MHGASQVLHPGEREEGPGSSKQVRNCWHRPSPETRGFVKPKRAGPSPRAWIHRSRDRVKTIAALGGSPAGRLAAPGTERRRAAGSAPNWIGPGATETPRTSSGLAPAQLDLWRPPTRAWGVLGSSGEIQAAARSGATKRGPFVGGIREASPRRVRTTGKDPVLWPDGAVPSLPGPRIAFPAPGGV